MVVIKIAGGHLGRPTCQFIKPKHHVFGAASYRLTGQKEGCPKRLGVTWRPIGDVSLLVRSGHVNQRRALWLASLPSGVVAR